MGRSSSASGLWVDLSQLASWRMGARGHAQQVPPTLEKEGARALAAYSFLLNLPLILGALQLSQI